MDANLRGRDGDTADEEKILTTATEKERVRARVRARATRRTTIVSGGVGPKTTMTEAAVEATAVTSRVDTGAATTATTATMATMVMATTMTRLNVCDASTEEKEHLLNPSQMHATARNYQIDERTSAERVGRWWRGLRSVVPALARMSRRRREKTQ